MNGRRPPIRIDDPDISHPRQAVSSAAVSHVGYDAEFAILYVTYHPKPGADPMSYVYFDVPLEGYEALMQAGSIGTHVNTVIKKTYYCLPEY